MSARATLAGLLAAGIALPAMGADCDNPVGDWTTNMGATVHIEAVEAETGRLTGDYQPFSMPDRRFPLTGFINPNKDGDVGERHYAVGISFAVSFQEFGGITAWSGVCHIENDKPVIDTEDLIVAPIADYVWSHVIDNHDRLVPR